MNDAEMQRCKELTKCVCGGLLSSRETEALISACGSYAQYRITLVLRLANRSKETKKIAASWVQRIEQPSRAPDANTLLHMLENIGQKQSDLERQLLNESSVLVEKLHALDANAAALVKWRTGLDEIRIQMADLRERLIKIEDLPLQHQENVK